MIKEKYFVCAITGLNNWVMNTEVLEDPAFADIKQQLTTLTLIDYKPKKILLQ
jgi:hypothetical protein